MSCLKHFEDHLHPKNPDTWKETIRKLNDIDKIPFDKIIEITEKTRKDQFWSKNFLTLAKLRNKNKDGIMYSIVFNENLKTKKNDK